MKKASIFFSIVIDFGHEDRNLMYIVHNCITAFPGATKTVSGAVFYNSPVHRSAHD